MKDGPVKLTSVEGSGRKSFFQWWRTPACGSFLGNVFVFSVENDAARVIKEDDSIFPDVITIELVRNKSASRRLGPTAPLIIHESVSEKIKRVAIVDCSGGRQVGRS